MFAEAVRRLKGWPPVRLIQVTSELRDEAVEMFSARPDKNWGLVDCASFLVMSKHGVFDAFTTDRHFEQAGFNCLLPAVAV